MSLEPGPAGDPVDPDAANTIGASTARAYSLVPVAFEGDTLVVAVSEPDDAEALSVVRELTRRQTKAVVSTPAAIDRARDRVYGVRPQPHYRIRRHERPDAPPPTPAELRRAEQLARHAGLELVRLELGPDGSDPVDHQAARRLPQSVCPAYRLPPVAAEIGRLAGAVAAPCDAARQRVGRARTATSRRRARATAKETDRATRRVFATLRG